MVVDALYLANPVFHFADHLNDPEEYIKYTDNILNHISFSKNPVLKQSQEILKRIHSREIFRYVGQILVIEKPDPKLVSPLFVKTNQTNLSNRFLKKTS